MSGCPNDLTKTELTTVTGRLRRVFTYSKRQIQEACIINGVTKLAFNFANYIDWSCYGCNDFNALPTKVLDFIKMVEDDTSTPVAIVGTGPKLDQICYAD